MLRRFALTIVFTFAFTCTASAQVLMPAKDTGNSYGLYSMAYHSTGLYVITGDSLYRLNETTDSFDLLTTGLRSAFGGSPRSFDGGIAINTAGLAFIYMGSEGGALTLDLPNPAATPQIVPPFTGQTTFDNIYSAAAGPDGRFHTQRVHPDWLSFTDIYTYDPVAESAAFVVEAAPGDFSGATAVRGDGRIIAGTFTYLDGQSFPIGTARFWEIDPLDPNPVLLTQVTANGNGYIAFTPAGDLIFATNTGIAMLDSVTFDMQTLYGNVADPNLITGPEVTLEGLAYDPVQHRLYFSEFDADLNAFVLRTFIVPEPATMALLVLGVSIVLNRRKR